MEDIQYQHLDEIDHILNRPDMYVGSTNMTKKEMFVYDFETKRCILKEIDYNAGLERIFLEPLSNACDNAIRSREKGMDAGSIFVTIQEGKITIRNEGSPIQIKFMDDYQMYTPEFIFSKLRTGSNFDDNRERQLCGRNGFGVKLTNVYSTTFSVDVQDEKSNYQQEWRRNMRDKQTHQLKQTKQKPFTSISYTADFSYFYRGTEIQLKDYTSDFVGLLAKHCLNASFTTRIPVHFQNEVFSFSNMKLFAQVYSEHEIDKLNFLEYNDDNNQLLIVDTPDQGQIISFVNGMYTSKGGVHVEAFLDKIIEPVIEKINSKDKSKKAEKKKKINKGDVKPHLSIFLASSISNPEFDNQSKETLMKPKPKVPKLEDEGKKMLKWQLVDRLKASLDAKNYKNLDKGDVKKKMFISHTNLEDAGFAGSARSKECMLFLCEGLSASSFVIKGTGTKRDVYGVFPLKGKPLNVTKSSSEKVNDNTEIQSLRKIIGLKSNVDYSQDENLDTLRYGSVCLACDADVDGIHIRFLLHNLFMEHYKTLLKRGFVKVLLTPIIKAVQGKQAKKFYSEKAFQQWLQEDENNKTWKTYHMKGLATSEDEDISEEFTNPNIVVYDYDEKAEDYFKIAFEKYMEDLRKKWILNYDPNVNDTQNKEGSLSYGINNELILYSVYSVKTKLPSLFDGLKVCQRKILYGAIKKGRKEFIKVDQLASYVAELTSYHHGEGSLSDAIINMGQDFIGSNNVPLLEKKGQFGSRKELGKDAGSGRYIYTRISNIVQYLFRQEDEVLLEQVVDENDVVEPKHYYSIVPIFALNGVEAIASGFSTKIWNRNPKQVIQFVKSWVLNQTLPELKPHFKDYQGKIDKDATGWYTEGSFHTKYSSVIVDELPVNISFSTYEAKLSKLKEKKVITDFKSGTTSLKVRSNKIEVQPRIDIRGCKNPSIKKLKLKKSLSENVVLLDSKGIPKHYENLEQAMVDFCQERYKLYELRKEKTIPYLEQELKVEKKKLKFIEEVVHQKLIIHQRDEQDLLKDLKSRGFDESFLQMSIRSLTRQKLEEQTRKVKSQEEKLNVYKNTHFSHFWIQELQELEKHL